MSVHGYISSGELEAYALGMGTKRDRHEVEMMAAKYPEVARALRVAQTMVEQLAIAHRVDPPPGVWGRIHAVISTAGR